MDIKCINNPFYNLSISSTEKIRFREDSGSKRLSVCCPVNTTKRLERVENVNFCGNIMIKRPIASKSAIGLLSIDSKIVDRIKNYYNNIKHTFDHKIVFALIEKELFGKISKDSITHDLDKLVMYALGFSHSFVSKFHRKISEHHTESGKKNNIKSMLCDNIASSPIFKPEKKKSVRDFYNSSIELQNVPGFGDILEKYNYGEDIDFKKIMTKKAKINNIPRKIVSSAKSFCAFLF